MSISLRALLGAALALSAAAPPVLAQARAGRHQAICAPTDARPLDVYQLSPLQTRVLGERTWLRNGPASLRVVTTNHNTGKPVPATITLSAARVENGRPGENQTLFTGKTNDVGTIDATFRVPNAEPGAYQLTVDVKSQVGHDTVNEQIQIQEATQLLLTTDKPLFQPGQTMHLRALALDVATRQAVGDKPITFEIEDARGNKVFKKKQTLSRFGVAAADFVLADEVNMGNFVLRAILATGQAEKTVRVERYVLPKFKITVTTDKPYYLPGEEVKGTVKANYFFGKPVANGKVTVEINTVDIGVTKLEELKGDTSPIGAYTFRYTLPRSFVGQPFEQGKAVIEFHTTLKDTADHKQESHLSVPVVKEPILLVVVPETRNLVPGVENRVYIAAGTPDGAPLKNMKLEVSRLEAGAGRAAVTSLTTDELGIATYWMTPPNPPAAKAPNGAGGIGPLPAGGGGRRFPGVQGGFGGGRVAGGLGGQAMPGIADLTVPIVTTTLIIKATDSQGRTATTSQTLQTAPSNEGIILRSDKTLARVGDRLNLVALSTVQTGTLYLDVIRNRQTILTHAQPMSRGETRFMLPVTPDMAGTLEIRAYKILPNEDIVRDSRTVIISPADDLDIQVAADRAEYRPGGDATLNFTVTNKNRLGVEAALGIAIVDESVFGLSELQPGLEKIYFMLEKELMEPRYEIHGLTPSGLLQQGPIFWKDASRQRAAALVLAAAPVAPDFEIRVDTFEDRWSRVRDAAVQDMQRRCQTIQNAIQKYRKETRAALTIDKSLTELVRRGYLGEADLLDPWGSPYLAFTYGSRTYEPGFSLNSPGPDRKWQTPDDLIGVSVYGWNPGGIAVIRWHGNEELLAQFGITGQALAKGDDNSVILLSAPMDSGRGPGGFGGGFGGGRMAGAGVDRDLGFAERRMFKFGATELAARSAKVAAVSGPDLGVGSAAPRVREYFPETMLWQPALITDEHGRAMLKVPMADSITTWRVSVMGNTPLGQLGSATSPIKVFQDFFADIDLPVSLTQHDRVRIPVSVYNYMQTPQDVTLTLKQEPWFRLDGSARQSLRIDAGQVKVVYYPVVADDIGRHTLEVTARGSKLSDALRRQIEVTPDGKENLSTINDRLEKSAQKTVSVPAGAIKGATSLFVKLYPGTFSQVVEGLDGILRMPNGCFEQTSSTTYPNILVLDYLKTTKRLNPELQMKAEQYINVGYQRLVTFECKHGGFSWFGDEPAHQILTAYGLLEFSDMSKVHEVDPALIARTQTWLAAQQKPDGTWEEKNQGIAEGIINRQTGALRTTAYVSWALAESGYQGPQIAMGVGYVKEHRTEAKDPYTMAVILNLLAKVERDGESTARAADALIHTATVTDKTACWQSETQTFTGANGHGADLETTGLAAYGLVKWGRDSGFVNKVLTYLVQSKDAFGTWESTQGTVWSMKSLLYASRNGTASQGTVTIVANGQKAGAIKITSDDSDVVRQVNLAEFVKVGENDVRLDYEGDGSLLYQIVERHYMPWQEAPRPLPAIEPLALSVDYDKTTLAQDDTATVTVKVHNLSDRTAEMPLIDVGVPPAFTVISDKLDDAVKAATISKYTIAARQVIVYLEKLDPGQTVTFTYQVRARFPIKAKTPLSRAYPYYNPERVTVSQPKEITVTQ